jgi:hypothetical protein
MTARNKTRRSASSQFDVGRHAAKVHSLQTSQAQTCSPLRHWGAEKRKKKDVGQIRTREEKGQRGVSNKRRVLNQNNHRGFFPIRQTDLTPRFGDPICFKDLLVGKSRRWGRNNYFFSTAKMIAEADPS